MKQLDVFDIILDSPKRVYYAGDVVRGDVTLECSKPLKINKITVTVSGRGEVFWSGVSSVDKNGKASHMRTGRIRQYWNSENYMDVKQVIYDKDGDSVIPAGSHTFPFQQTLPKGLPSSFKGSYGKINYHVRACLNMPWNVRDEDTKKAFSVVSIVDLNTIPNVTLPRAGRDQRALGCLCLKTGPISADFKIPRRGFVPGECIQIEGRVVNQSDRKIKATRILLRMKTTFRASGGSSTRLSQIVSSLKRGEIPPGGTEEWNGRRLHIPPLPPSPLNNCSIMSLAYELVMLVEPSGFSLDLEVPLKIQIGAIPLQDVAAVYVTRPDPEPLSGLDIDDCQPPPYSDVVHTAPPPSYGEWLSGYGEEEDDAAGGDDNPVDSTWVPIFPYFAYGSSPQDQFQPEPSQEQDGSQEYNEHADVDDLKQEARY